MAALLTRRQVVNQLAKAGFADASHEGGILWAASGGEPYLLQQWLTRRTDGEPLEWIVGMVRFCGVPLHIGRGVYVPRPQTEPLALRAAAVLPEGGLAVDIATGCGAVAAVLARQRRCARVVATDIEAVACECARHNGVEVYQGHLAAPVPGPLWGRFDLVFAVVPYVPTAEMQYLPRDVRHYEPVRALDGGDDGVIFLNEVVASGPWLLRPGGTMVLELGGNQDVQLSRVAEREKFEVIQRFIDQDGDLRGIELRFSPEPR